MSLIHFNYYSASLSRITDFYVVSPDDMNPMMTQGNPHFDRPAKLLMLLHGYSGNAADWVTGSPIRELAGKYNLVVVMPSGENSFYTDAPYTGGKYCTFIGKELVDYVRKMFRLSDKKEDTLIGGFSMGGYGAIHIGLTFPETFSKVIGLSNALIVEGLDKIGDGNPVANREYYELCFGDLSRAAATMNNPKVQVETLQAEGSSLPAFWLGCGTEDFLYTVNKEFAQFMKDKGTDVTYYEAPGIHNWTFWNSCLEPSFTWALGKGAE